MTEIDRVPLRKILRRFQEPGAQYKEADAASAAFLLRLVKIDQQGLTSRDVLALYVVAANPSITGLDLARMLGHENRSALDSNIRRLITHGFIEDRRVQARKAEPNQLYITPAGLEFWADLKA